MAAGSGIEVEGVIREVLADGLYRAELVNGHKPLAHLNSSARRAGARFVPGDKVILVMSFYDLSVGRIKS
jgi:translation initiation factor IF-1